MTDAASAPGVARPEPEVESAPPFVRRAVLRGLVLGTLFAPTNAAVQIAILVARGRPTWVTRERIVVTLAAGALAGLAGVPVSAVELLMGRVSPRPARDLIAGLAAGAACFLALVLAFFGADYVESRVIFGISPRESIHYMEQLWDWMAVRPSDYTPTLALLAAPLGAVVAVRLGGFGARCQTLVALGALALLGLAGALALDVSQLRAQGGPLIMETTWELVGCLLLGPLAPFAFNAGEWLDRRVERFLAGHHTPP